jgi:hypothetical protein
MVDAEPKALSGVAGFVFCVQLLPPARLNSCAILSSIAPRIEAHLALEDPVDADGVGEDEGDADDRHEEEDLEGFDRGGGVVDREAERFGGVDGANHFWVGADCVEGQEADDV